MVNSDTPNVVLFVYVDSVRITLFSFFVVSERTVYLVSNFVILANKNRAFFSAK